MRTKTPLARRAHRQGSIASWLAPFAAGLLLCGSASAHIELTDPPARYHRDHQKAAPCGLADNPPGENPPTVLVGGETITVHLDEFIPHPGHFRIAIAPSDAEFVNPTAFDDFYNADNVVLDDIEDVQGVQFHEIELEVPDIDCDPCVMQVLQIMHGGSFSTGSLYFQCADIVIEGSGAATTGPDDDTGNGDGDPSGGDPTGANDGDGDTGMSDGDTTAASADDGQASGTETGDTGVLPGGGGDDGGGCSCRANQGPPAGIAVLGLLVLGAFRRRSR
jgi:MYXO-CTERM domain-containing protein